MLRFPTVQTRCRIKLGRWVRIAPLDPKAHWPPKLNHISTTQIPKKDREHLKGELVSPNKSLQRSLQTTNIFIIINFEIIFDETFWEKIVENNFIPLWVWIFWILTRDREVHSCKRTKNQNKLKSSPILFSPSPIKAND